MNTDELEELYGIEVIRVGRTLPSSSNSIKLTDVRHPKQFTEAEWVALPFELRQRWWRETGWGTCQPSQELRQAIVDCLKEKS